MIEKMTNDTVKGAVDFHIQCFRDSFLANLDRGILTCMYENYVSTDLGRAFVYLKDGEVIGIIAGTINPSVYYNQLLKKRGLRLIWMTLKRVIREPKILVPIARRNFSGFFRPDESAYHKASLDVIGVKEEYRGSGIAQQLTETFFSDLKERGVTELTLGVLASNTRSIRFYEKVGLKHLRTVQHPTGDDLYIYGIRFDDSSQESTNLDRGLK